MQIEGLRNCSTFFGQSKCQQALKKIEAYSKTESQKFEKFERFRCASKESIRDMLETN